jgi:hypothetical protein
MTEDTYRCRWHPHTSRSGFHTKRQCLDFHRRQLATATTELFRKQAGPKLADEHRQEAEEAIKELEQP